MASEDLENEIQNYALSFNMRRDFVSVVCGAEYSNSRKCNKSGLLILENELYVKLKDKLLSYGKLGEKVNTTSIGCCAEVNASNDIYIKHVINLNEIVLSRAYRPKTMQVRDKCQICKDIFY
ncbi:hypothetical protein [Pedobacter sandarakinus]|uniref:hypothetical protein n=1 Tax=Pedobacter sandarakinus TaxID=353156 RepID=UPI0022460DD7|nr:hypothetical protein [Pedobacter sandarakinus]MCX2573654.1 hypothetical protein [Pedobacter sandarakinus]